MTLLRNILVFYLLLKKKKDHIFITFKFDSKTWTSSYRKWFVACRIIIHEYKRNLKKYITDL